MSCEHGNWPPCDLCDALEAAWKSGYEAGATRAPVVDEAMVERAFNAWCDVADVDEWRVRNTPEALRAALTAALAQPAQQGGES